MDNNNCCNCSTSNTNCGVYNNFQVQTTGSNITTSTGDSRAIRIGNDIKLDVTIQELNGMDIINIKAIKCFIINTTPMLQDHCGNAYEINRCGLPMYHCLPYHCGDYCSWKHHDHHYNGFGMYPCAHKNWSLHPHYDYFYRNPYGRSVLKCINPCNKPFEFIAPVKALPERNKVRVFFPAAAQALCGLYSLTFVIDLYQPGYHCNDLRTITVDYNNVFELVPNIEGAAGDIIIDIDKQIGLNVVDSFINNESHFNNQTQEPSIENITISPDENVRVGQVVEYKATCSPTDSNNIAWSLSDTGHALLGSIKFNTAQVYGKSISNQREGFDEVILNAHATDGSKVVGSKRIKIHNYATDIDFGAYGDRIIMPYGSTYQSTIYVTQEDGTRVSLCEMGCNCQAIEVGTAKILATGDQCVELIFGSCQQCDATMTPDNECSECVISDENTSYVSASGCCNKGILKIKNINTSDDTKIAIMRLTSNMKDENGNFPTKDITIVCLGKNGAEGGGGNTPGGDDQEDIYITSGQYRPEQNDILFQRHASTPLQVSLSGLEENVGDIWYYDNY